MYTWLTGNRTQSQTRTATGSRISSDFSARITSHFPFAIPSLCRLSSDACDGDARRSWVAVHALHAAILPSSTRSTQTTRHSSLHDPPPPRRVSARELQYRVLIAVYADPDRTAHDDPRRSLRVQCRGPSWLRTRPQGPSGRALPPRMFAVVKSRRPHAGGVPYFRFRPPAREKVSSHVAPRVASACASSTRPSNANEPITKGARVTDHVADAASHARATTS